MAISNINYANAQVIPSLPFNLTTTANDAGVTNSLWYQYTAISSDEVLSVFGFGNYLPTTLIYLEVAGIPDNLPSDIGTPLGMNVPVTFPVIAGQTYFFEFQYSGGFITPANLDINIISYIPQDYPSESLMIPDDTWGFPGAILSPTTGEVLKFILGFPAGEEGDALSIDGTILTEDYNGDSLKLFDGSLNLITSISFSSFGPTTFHGIGCIFALQSSISKFYVGCKGGGSDPAFFRTVSPTGIIGSIQNLPIAGLTSFAVNQAETIAYITGQGSSTNVIKRWDLINNIALTDFPLAAGLHKVLVLKNDHIIVSTYDNTVHTTTIREYDTSNTLLHIYTITDSNNSNGMRMKPAADNPTSIWIWNDIRSAGGQSQFIKLRLNDGTYLQDITATQFESGTYQLDPTINPIARFGHSFSCPIFVMYIGYTPPIPPDVSGLYYIHPNKTHDSYFNGVENKIPNPILKTAVLGE